MKNLLLILLPLLNISCAAQKPIIVQDISISTTPTQLDTAINNATSNLNFQIEEINDNKYTFTRDAFGDGDPKINIETKIFVRENTYEIYSTGAYDGIGKNERANIFAYMLNDAIDQEVHFLDNKRKYNLVMPQKSAKKFWALNLINPGIGLYYGHSSPLSRDSLKWASLGLGTIDLVYLGFALSDGGPTEGLEPELTDREIGILGLVFLRAMFGYFYHDQARYYNEVISRSPYYFDIKFMNSEINAVYKYDF